MYKVEKGQGKKKLCWQVNAIYFLWDNIVHLPLWPLFLRGARSLSTSVETKVCPEVSQLREALLTLLTQVGLLSRVDTLVSLQTS